MKKSVCRVIREFVASTGVQNKMLSKDFQHEIAPGKTLKKQTFYNPFTIAVKNLKRKYLRTPHNQRAAFKAALA